MQPRAAPLPPDVQYTIDGLGCDWYLTLLDASVLTLFGDIDTIMRIHDQDRPGRSFLVRMAQMALELSAHAHAVLRTLPRPIQESFVASAWLFEPNIVNDVGEMLASWNLTDSILGGCLQPYRRVRWNTTLADPSPRVRRRLHAPSSIRRYVRRSDELGIMQGLRAHYAGLPMPKSPTQANLVLDMHHRQQEARYAYIREQAFTLDLSDLSDLGIGSRALRFANAPIFGRPIRRMLTRSHNAAVAVIGEADTKLFRHGHPVTIIDGDLAFKIKRRDSLATVGHGALDITVLGNTTPLCQLCVYFGDMPTLDQLAAVAVYAQAGEARALIETGNPYGVTAAGAQHPLIKDRVKPRTDDAARRDRGTDGFTSMDRRKADQDAYYRATRPFYEEAIWTRLWGRRADQVRRFAEMGHTERSAEYAAARQNDCG
jgi:hypothetical protein